MPVIALSSALADSPGSVRQSA